MNIIESKNNVFVISLRDKNLNFNLLIKNNTNEINNLTSFLRNILSHSESVIFLDHYELFYKNNRLMINTGSVNFEIIVGQKLIDQFCDIIYFCENKNFE